MKIKIILPAVIFLTSFLFSQQKNFLSEEFLQPRMRVIVINDFGGDPDGLFQLVHQILSPSAEIRAIIGSHICNAGFFGVPEDAGYACKKANEVIEIMELKGKFSVLKGSDLPLEDEEKPRISEGTEAIINEAMRQDTDIPLYVVCGSGLTDIASAYIINPEIAQKLTLVWIGGPEYSGIAFPPPGCTSLEYNTSIDIKAARVIFNKSDMLVWQVPRNSYRQILVSYAELLKNVKCQGKIGKYLATSIEEVLKMANSSLGETYILGDNPLVLLTTLQSCYNSDPSSSTYSLMPAPKFNEQGLYEINPDGRNIRVYNNLDMRLLLEDFYTKLELFNKKEKKEQ